jgi:hypothetical protein
VAARRLPSARAALERGFDHIRRNQLAESAPGGPVTLTGSLDCPVEDVAGDVRQNDKMTSYRRVMAVFGEKIQQPVPFPDD